MIGRFTVDEFRALISDGRSWVSVIDWPPGRAWLFYDGPTGGHPGAPIPGDIVRSPGRLTVRFTTPDSARLTDGVPIRISARSEVPGWAAIRKLEGFDRVPKDDRAALRTALAALGSVLRSDDEPMLRETAPAEPVDPRELWDRILDLTKLVPGASR